MKKTIIFSRIENAEPTRTTSVNAIAEVDDFGNPFAAEVLWLKNRAGDEDCGMLLAALKANQISHCYAEEVDSLTLTFGEAVRSSGQQRSILDMEFIGADLVEVKLRERA